MHLVLILKWSKRYRDTILSSLNFWNDQKVVEVPRSHANLKWYDVMLH